MSRSRSPRRAGDDKDNILSAEKAIKHRIAVANGLEFPNDNRKTEEINKVIVNTLNEEYNKEVDNKSMNEANDIIQSSKINIRTIAEHILDLQKKRAEEREGDAAHTESAEINSKIKALKDFMIYNTIKYNEAITDLVKDNHHLYIYDSMNIHEVMENHAMINEIIENEGSTLLPRNIEKKNIKKCDQCGKDTNIHEALCKDCQFAIFRAHYEGDGPGEAGSSCTDSSATS